MLNYDELCDLLKKHEFKWKNVSYKKNGYDIFVFNNITLRIYFDGKTEIYINETRILKPKSSLLKFYTVEFELLLKRIEQEYTNAGI